MSSTELQFEKMLAIHCAPVLKKKKVANMFHIERNKFMNINDLVISYNQKLNKKGLFIRLFQSQCPRITIYVYCYDWLKSLLTQYEIRRFLIHYEYPIKNIDETLQYLDQRLTFYHEYPHEIGIFLGYPLCDVKGFINHSPCLCYGYWKVYDNEENTKHLFHLYDLCQQEVLSAMHCGQCIEQILNCNLGAV